jgi:hypothetical protein
MRHKHPKKPKVFRFKHERYASYGTSVGEDTVTVKIRGFPKMDVENRMREVGLRDRFEVLGETRSVWIQFQDSYYTTTDPTIAQFLRSVPDVKELGPDDPAPPHDVVEIGGIVGGEVTEQKTQPPEPTAKAVKIFGMIGSD